MSEEELESIGVSQDDYRLLSRLKADCDYYLGAGERAEKHLWAGSVEAQITKMWELYDALPEKPEWLTVQDIDRYESQMTGGPELSQPQKEEAAPLARNGFAVSASPLHLCILKYHENSAMISTSRTMRWATAHQAKGLPPTSEPSDA